MNTFNQFSGLAEEYTVSRPTYADEFIETLYSHYGFSEESSIADIGSGTGKFAKQLLDKGSYVTCVEPNDDMRNMSIKELGKYKKFRAVRGNASETTLVDKSVDYITTAQAFHWFDIVLFKKECQRILRENGRILLIWNIRDMSNEVNIECYNIYSKYCPKFKGFGGGIQKDDIRVKQFFNNEYEYVEFNNPLVYNKVKFISRSLSGSYSLKKDDENYTEFLEELSKVFSRYAKENTLTMANRTIAYIGKV